MRVRVYIVMILCLLSFTCNTFGTEMKPTIYCGILAGGSGLRLWPLSRQAKPKQLLTLGSDATLLEQAVDRIYPLTRKEHIWISTTKQHEKAIVKTVEKRVGRVLVEPASRNTGPAILLCCMQMYKQDPDAIIVFLPADPFIPKCDWPKFRDFLAHAIDHASHHDEIVLFGVRPTHAAAGYGYIEFDPKQVKENQAPYKVTRFREKPSAEVAQQYVESGNKLWNVSIFCAKAKTFLHW